MSKGLEALKRIKSHYNDRVCIDILEDFDLIEKELKDKEQQDSALKTLKEVIAFAKKLPDIEIDDDGNIECIIGAVGFTIQRQMENKERELLRNWILNTCFPKELKALEIIKEKCVSVIGIRVCDTFEEYNERYKNYPPLTQEEFELLKEVLL